MREYRLTKCLKVGRCYVFFGEKRLPYMYWVIGADEQQTVTLGSGPWRADSLGQLGLLGGKCNETWALALNSQM